jgi:hypothetical protein
LEFYSADGRVISSLAAAMFSQTAQVVPRSYLIPIGSRRSM